MSTRLGAITDSTAADEVERHEQAPDPAAFALHDAQRVLARSYGFRSWQKLKSYAAVADLLMKNADAHAESPAN